MATSTTVADFAKHIEKMGAAVAAGRKDAVNKAALEAKNTILDQLDTVVPSRRLRNVGSSGAKLGIGYDIKGFQNPTALVQARGPWQFIEYDNAPHWITSKYGGGSRKSRAQRLGGMANPRARGNASTSFLGNYEGGGNPGVGGSVRVPSAGYRRWARHPGTKGKRPFAKGIERARPRVEKLLGKFFVDVVKRLP